MKLPPRRLPRHPLCVSSAGDIASLMSSPMTTATPHYHDVFYFRFQRMAGFSPSFLCSMLLAQVLDITFSYKDPGLPSTAGTTMNHRISDVIILRQNTRTRSNKPNKEVWTSAGQGARSFRVRRHKGASRQKTVAWNFGPAPGIYFKKLTIQVPKTLKTS